MIYSPDNHKWWRQSGKEPYWTKQDGATTWLKRQHAELAIKKARQSDKDAYIEAYEIGKLLPREQDLT